MAHDKVFLVTGFGRFPGAPFNLTERIVAALGGAFARRLARLGWRLEGRVLPVAWEALPRELARLEAELAPDAVLHLGLAARRTKVTVEKRAHNRRRPLSYDAAGRRADSMWIEQGAPFTREGSQGAARMVVALSRVTPAAPSNDAGAYLCNLALWESLARGRKRPVAFVHVPRTRLARRRGNRARPSSPRRDDLAAAARAACLFLIGRARITQD